jgi:hypothetical protein
LVLQNRLVVLLLLDELLGGLSYFFAVNGHEWERSSSAMDDAGKLSVRQSA